MRLLAERRMQSNLSISKNNAKGEKFMPKRNKKEIERDYKRIKELISNNMISTLEEMGKILGISRMQILKSLELHPRKKKEILGQLEKNRKMKSAKREKKPFSNEYVIDASICGTTNLKATLKEIIENEGVLVLTDITIEELGRLQNKKREYSHLDARYVLKMAAENPNYFKLLRIDKDSSDADSCIVKYCLKNKDNTILLTADKLMAEIARLDGIEVIFLKKEYNIRTLRVVEKFEDKLLITKWDDDYKSVQVISDGFEYSDGIYELKIKDNVYVATKKKNYCTFAHYRIISLEPYNNCVLIYGTRIHENEEIKKLPKGQYRSFMREFERKHSL